MFGIRSLRRRTREDIEAWKASLPGVSDAIDVEIASQTHTFANWSYFDTSKPLPLEGEWAPVTRNQCQCGIPLLGLQITTDGSISFCACANFDATPDLVIGNLNEISLKQALASEKAKRLWDWQTHGVPAFCQTCSFHTLLSQMAAINWVYANPTKYIGG